jgi:tRNA threonylcarbamoyl adenosine modification protein YeaZ
MKILAFDTALRACSVAVLVDGAIHGQGFEVRSRGHAEVLITMINQVCADAGIGMAEFDRLAVTVGPGTFAGVRIGIAAARGFAVSLSLPVVGVTTLEAVAASALSELNPGESHVTALFDARRGQVYAQSFDPKLGSLAQPRAASPQEVLDDLPLGAGALVGDGAMILADILSANRPDLRLIAVDRQPDAVIIGRLAAERSPARPGSGEPSPLYLRPPDAKLPAARAGSK